MLVFVEFTVMPTQHIENGVEFSCPLLFSLLIVSKTESIFDASFANPSVLQQVATPSVLLQVSTAVQHFLVLPSTPLRQDLHGDADNTTR